MQIADSIRVTPNLTYSSSGQKIDSNVSSCILLFAKLLEELSCLCWTANIVTVSIETRMTEICLWQGNHFLILRMHMMAAEH